jgi:hypothetical protein
MKKGFIIIGLLFIFAIAAISFSGCGKNELPPDLPEFRINVTIEPNSTLYQPLNVVGGWMYLGYSEGIDPPSRGVIVYRWTTDQFIAFERTPPYEWNKCCDQGICTHLIVDNYYPFVFDTCTQSKFLLIDGSVVEGPSTYPLIKYQAQFDGNLLYIYN